MDKNSVARILHDTFESSEGLTSDYHDRKKYINFCGLNFWTFLEGVKLAEEWSNNKQHYIISEYSWKCWECRQLHGCIILKFYMPINDFKTILHFIESNNTKDNYLPTSICPYDIFYLLVQQYSSLKYVQIKEGIYVADNHENIKVYTMQNFA